MAKENYQCEKCNRILKEDNFYTYRNGQKTEMCKSCLTMHVNNWEPETYTWILEKMDVPYIPSIWTEILDKEYAKNPDKINGTSVLGRYLSKMRLKQWKDKTWADTAALQQEYETNRARKEEEQEQYEAMLKEQLDNREINESQYRTLVGSNTQRKVLPNINNATVISGYNDPFQENNFIAEEEINNMIADLTEDDKRYLALKWRPPLYSKSMA